MKTIKTIKFIIENTKHNLEILEDLPFYSDSPYFHYLILEWYSNVLDGVKKDFEIKICDETNMEKYEKMINELNLDFHRIVKITGK